MENAFDNVIDNVSLQDKLITAFEDLDQILTDHSGPFATNCVIGSKWRQVNDVDEFTKDGIKILRHLLVSEDPVTRFAARMARFIGIAVDSRCHDGTTTSMLTFCRLAKLAVSRIDADNFDGTRYKWAKALEKSFATCLKELEGLKITENDLHELSKAYGLDSDIVDIRASLAYHMAMISSKGDHDLSDKISYVIRSCPKKIFGMFANKPLAVETEERYILKKQTYDIAIDGNLGNVTDYNYKNDTQYLAEHAVIFATGSDIAHGSNEALFLKAFISDDLRHSADLSDFGCSKGWRSLHGGKHHLILITPMLADSELIAEINIFNMEHPEIKISWINAHVKGRMRSSLNKTLHYMAGIPTFGDVTQADPTRSLIGLQGRSVRAHLIGHTITLENLYEKDDHVYHPLYRNPEAFPPYTRFAKETEELILFAKENITNPSLDQDEVTYLTYLYRCLTCQEIYDIEIGGSAHDQYANGTVYEDAIGAALSAVEEGVVLGGYGRFAQLFRTLNLFADPIMESFSNTFLSIVEDSLRLPEESNLVSDLIMTEAYGKWSYVAADTEKYLTSTNPKDYIGMFHLNKDMMERFLQKDPKAVILFQAYGGYHEQFRRCRDILVKLANTTHLADMRINDAETVR